jgi:hypothetical protein
VFCLDINGLFFLNSGSLCILCKYSLKTNGRHMTRREGCLPSYPTFRNDYSHLSNFSFYGLGFCSIYFCCPTQSKCQTTKSVYANFIFYVSNYICKHSKCYIFVNVLWKWRSQKWSTLFSILLNWTKERSKGVWFLVILSWDNIWY